MLVLLLCGAVCATLQHGCSWARRRLEDEDGVSRQDLGVLLFLEGAMQMATTALIALAVVEGTR